MYVLLALEREITSGAVYFNRNRNERKSSRNNLPVNKKALTSPGRKCLIFKWAQLESNQPPTDYESVALTE